MKKHVMTFIGALSLLLAAGSAFAQTINLKAGIPFEFVVNETTLQAGEYQLVSSGIDGSVLLIRDADGHGRGFILTNSAESGRPCDQTKLVFLRYGDQYFLSEIWREGDTSGHQVPKSRRQTEMAQDFISQQVLLMAQLK
jgi:hypothetical protein